MKKIKAFLLLAALLLAVCAPALAQDDIDWEIYWTLEMKDVVDVGSLDNSLVQQTDVRNYIAKDGTTSAVVDRQETIWIKEESAGNSAWYGLDNSDGAFQEGSRFWARWVNRGSGAGEWEKNYARMDEIHKQNVEDDNLWIFQMGVTMPDGEEYTILKERVPVYIQLGDDWDRDDVQALFIDEGSDEVVDVRCIDAVSYPEGSDRFAVLQLEHFSPYAIYDAVDSSGAAMLGSGAATPDLPKTGDASNLILWIALLTVCGAAAWLLWRRSAEN